MAAGAAPLSGTLPRVGQAPWQSVPQGAPLLSCSACGVAVPMTQAQVTHLRWHARIAALIAALERRLAEAERAAQQAAGEGDDDDRRAPGQQ